jgi:hypothetical protein
VYPLHPPSPSLPSRGRRPEETEVRGDTGLP